MIFNTLYYLNCIENYWNRLKCSETKNKKNRFIIFLSIAENNL